MMPRRTGWILGLIAVAFAFNSVAQTLYKFRGEDGEWIYSDRPPNDGEVSETRDLITGSVRGKLSVSHAFVGRSIQLVASNEFYAPVELTLDFNSLKGMSYPHPDQELRWVLPPRSETILLDLPVIDTVAAPDPQYTTLYTLGSPAASHQPASLYRVPYAIANKYAVTQAYPNVSTHDTLDAYHAVDIAMPVGTNIFAARGGIVFDVADTNFRGGLDRERDGPGANIIRVLHDDGTYAIYAHLNWNTIRVRPGDRVQRGEYIADSGNTGFSSGPHLHFVVIRNSGMKPESVPLRFEGANSSAVVPATGGELTAY